jgi:hypothetical protein
VVDSKPKRIEEGDFTVTEIGSIEKITSSSCVVVDLPIDECDLAFVSLIAGS